MAREHKSHIAGLTALMFVCAGPASAEDPAPPDQGPQPLETVVVTAQKRSEGVQQVPMSVTAISQQQLEDQHATQLSDYVGYIPGLQIQPSGTPAQGTLSLRGITPLGTGSTVATYVDETPIGASSLYGGAVGTAGTVLDLLPFDFERVEVLRGPQGTLYGASSAGGLLKYVTQSPNLDHYSVLAGTDVFALDSASGAGFGGRARVSAPIVPGQLGVSVSFAREDTPGYIDNVRSGATGANDFNQQVGRLALLWRAAEDLSVSLSGIVQRIHSNDSSFVALTPTLQPIVGDRKNNSFILQPFTQDFDYLTGTIKWNLGWADFISATSFSQTKSDQVNDASLTYGILFPLFGAPAGISAFDSHLNLHKTTEEMRLTSTSQGRWEWLVGAFYDHENSINDQVATAQLLSGLPIAGLNPLAVAQLPAIYDEYAVFGDATYRLMDQLDLTAGLRWARNDQSYSQNSSGAIIATGTTPGTSSQDVVTYAVSPRWHIDRDTMAYARIASGYQPGGPNAALPGVPPSVDADTLTNYELGLKSQLAERRLQVDLAAFYIDWNNLQVGTSNGAGLSYLVNAGRATSKGFEFDSIYAPLRGLRLELNGAYTDAKLTQDVPSIGGLSGDQLPYAPHWSGSFLASYAFLHSGNWVGSAGGGVHYVGERGTAVTHSPLAEPLSSYAAVDLNASLSSDHWTVRLFVKNLFNRYVYVNELTISNGATGAVSQVNGVPLQPRVVGLGLEGNL